MIDDYEKEAWEKIKVQRRHVVEALHQTDGCLTLEHLDADAWALAETYLGKARDDLVELVGIVQRVMKRRHDAKDKPHRKVADHNDKKSKHKDE